MTNQILTRPSELDQSAEGYVVIAPLSEVSKQRIEDIQSRFTTQFHREDLWLPKNEQLHITFAHIITPNVESSEDSSSLYDRIGPLAITALKDIVTSPFSIISKFNAIEVSLSAVTLKATDDGSFSGLRKQLINRSQPPEGTKIPPEIIHTTLLRFINPLNLEELQDLSHDIMKDFEPFEENTTSLQIVHEKKIFLQDHDVLEEFPLVAKLFR